MSRLLVWLPTRLASPRLTLWLLGLLAAVMAAGTVIPQQAPPEAYVRALGDRLGVFVAHSSWRHVYCAWWFICGFALLAVNLAACIAVRLRSLLWSGGQARTAFRGRVLQWGPLLVHVGVVAVLIGAGWGHLPGRSFHRVGSLYPGQSSTVEHGGARIMLRLISAGMKQAKTGQPTDFWARVEAGEGSGGERVATIRPSHPLRLGGFTVVLQSLLPEEYQIEVRRGNSVALVPVTFTAQGEVDPMRSVGRVAGSPWVVLVHSLRATGDSRDEVEARVYLHPGGDMGGGWQDLGWVTTRGRSWERARLRLIASGVGAEFSVDQDPGLVVVWAGCGLLTVGALLVAGVPRRRLIFLVVPGGAADIASSMKGDARRGA